MKLRHFLFFIALVIVVVLAYNQFAQVHTLRDLLKDIHWWLLLLIVPVRYLYYKCNAKYFEHFFAIFKERATSTKLLQTTITMNFVNIVFPSGGISGLSYLRKAHDGEISSANVTLAQLSWYVLSFFVYVTFLSLGFVMLLLSNQVIRVSSRIILLVLLLILIAGIIGLVFIINPRLIENIAFVAVRPINRFLRTIRKRVLGRERIRNFLEQIHTSIMFLRDHRRSLGKPLFFAAGMILMDLITLYIVFVAFGQVVNPGIIIAGYIIALISSVASLITAGVGVYEAAMVATFVGLNVPFDVAFAVVVVYRTATLWLFIPIGLIFYKRTLLDKPHKKKGS